MKITNQLKLATAVAAGIALVGCDSDSDSCFDDDKCTASGFEFPANAVFISPDAKSGSDITAAIADALFEIPDDSVVVLPKGSFKVNQSVIISNASGLTFTGHGIEATKLNFDDSTGDDGIRFDAGNDITIRDLGVYEAPKNGIKADGVNGIHMTYTSAIWETSLEEGGEDNGAYGLYPVSSENVLLEHNYSKGSADAGIYVGQSDNIVVRNNIAEHNVAGIEIENSTFADVYNNKAFDNSGGILSFDLPGLPQESGGNIRIFNNESYSNNTTNVGPGTVGIVPSGTGILILATSDVEIYNNDIRNNKSTGVAISSYMLVDDDLPNYATKYGATIASGWSPLVKNVYIHDNTYTNNSVSPAQDSVLGDTIAGYWLGQNASGQAQDYPAIIYDGIGELLSNAGQLAGFGYGPYTNEDSICASNSINKNSTISNVGLLDLNVGTFYGTDPTDALNWNADMSAPQATLRVSTLGSNSTLLNCTQTRLAVATVTFKGKTYGCDADDIDEPACKL
jgi:parallel beta-helix repeat protein